MTTMTESSADESLLASERVALVGRLGGMSKRDAQQLVRRYGGVALERLDGSATLVVLGEGTIPLDGGAQSGGTLADSFDGELRSSLDRGTARVVPEAEFWQRLGLVDREQDIHRLYTPAMLAGLLGVGVSEIRRWQRRGWIVPAREVRRLPYFDFQEVATARRLIELLAAGMSPSEIERKLGELARYLPDVKRPLAQLSIIVEGKQLLVRQGDELLEPGGQRRFDFGAAATEAAAQPAGETGAASDILSFAAPAQPAPHTPAEMMQMAGQLEDSGELEAAADMYRAALAAGGPSAEINFLLAELLYQMHDLSAARERYYQAIELDENYVEARANLGCVLADLGQRELAISAFEGALVYHEGYPDVHYHLARLLDDLGRAGDAEEHWRSFLRLAPTSPWADEARQRLEP